MSVSKSTPIMWATAIYFLAFLSLSHAQIAIDASCAQNGHTDINNAVNEAISMAQNTVANLVNTEVKTKKLRTYVHSKASSPFCYHDLDHEIYVTLAPQ